MPILFVLIGVLIAFGLYIVSVYNFLQSTRTRIEASIQEIGNQLKRQASLIPNLSESAKAYLKHEKDIFKELTSARRSIESAASSSDGLAIDQAMNQVQQLLPKLQVLVEDNPELKADGLVEKLMNELRDTSDKVMYSRRTLIDLSQSFNQKLVTFPSNLVANIFNFKKEDGLKSPVEGSHIEVSEEETKDVKVSLD